MKFTNGLWLPLEGYTPYFASQTYDVATSPDSLTAYAPVKPVHGRADTLDQGMVTVRYTSPMPNVIRVQVSHHQGTKIRPPSFELKPQPAPEVAVEDGEQEATLTSGRLTVAVKRGDGWAVEFRDGERVITGNSWRATGYIDTPDGRYIHDQLSLSVGECVYGLGERFTAFVKNGQPVDIWNADGGTASDKAYKNIPFYMTNRGYGVFVNHPERVSFEVASEKVDAGAVQRARREPGLFRHLRAHPQGGAASATPPSPAARPCRPPGRSASG